MKGRADQVLVDGGSPGIPGPAREARTALEDRLAGHPLVAAVRVVERQDALCIVVVPDAAGITCLRMKGWLGFTEMLLPGGVPGRRLHWRIVEELPHQGDPAALDSVVDAPLPNRPHVMAERKGPGATLALRLLVPLDVSVCREHFPRAPLVPGVVQLSWAAAFARERLGARGDFVALEAVKFQKILQPSTEFNLQLAWQADDGRLLLESSSSAGRHAVGRLVFEGH